MTIPKTPWIVTGDKEKRNIMVQSKTEQLIFGRPVYDVVCYMGHHPDKQDEAMAIAEHIVACVNACAGFSTDEIRSSRFLVDLDCPQNVPIPHWALDSDFHKKKFKRKLSHA